ncbi:MAG TPA: glycosyltransferase [Verrucomicrobiae bacterium]|jgi:glycosyltransferase involved in cell wall biosynthesis|nr:glycosyltransferase [Verrucomicrobiae bacterium]
MRLAFLTHEPFFPPSGGGSAEAVYLVEEMVGRGWEVQLFCPKIADPEGVRKRFGVNLHEFTTWEMGRYTKLRNAKYLIYPFFLQRLVERSTGGRPYDFLFSQHAIAAVTAGRLKKKWRVPAVMNFLDYLTGFMETWPVWLAPPPALAVLKQFELSLPKRYGVDGLLTVSDTLADYFEKAGYSREKILPIYYGYDSQLFLYRDPKPWAIQRPPVIVMHGSLDHHHLRDIALFAMDRVARELPVAIFRFVGQKTAALESFLARARERVPSAKIELTGFVPYAEVAAHLHSADLGIVPYEESTGTHCAFVAKIVEYLAVGLPVVSTSINSVSRYFANEPTVKFAGFDGGRFGDAILESLRNPASNLVPAARAASERVKRELDWRAISRKACDFVQKIADRNSPFRKAPP